MSATEATAAQVQQRLMIEDLFERWLAGPVDVDLPDFVDALGDIDYVIEGTRSVFGVDGAPIAAEIHRANMSKEPNGWGKPAKPANWTPPDIEWELRRQGWEEPTL
jgi:predicted HAD superfamily Cof-like phosphohydrolase